jgi:phage terminase small subunit
MPVLANARHERFAQEVAQGKSLTDAYAAAGYKADDGNASRLAAKPHMAARIDELKAEAAEAAGISAQQVLDAIAAIAFAAPDPLIGARAKLKALELLGKHFGLFKGKVDHSGQISHVIILPANERLDRLIDD